MAVAALLAATGGLSAVDAPFLDYLHSSMGVEVSRSLCALSSSMHEELATSVAQRYNASLLGSEAANTAHIFFGNTTSQDNYCSTTSRSAVPELRRRAGWMSTSVSRFLLRYIFDSEPYQISTPGLAGPADFSSCRSLELW